MDNDTDDTIDESVEGASGETLTPSMFEDPDPSELLSMEPYRKPPPSRKPQLLAKERRTKAIQLRISGATYEQIAEQCGYASAHSAGEAIRNEVRKMARESAGELKAIQYERLNYMLLLLQPGVMSSDLGSINTALSIMDRMNTLYGIGVGSLAEEQSAGSDAIVVIEGDEDQYIERLKELAGYVVPESMRESLRESSIDANVVDDTST